VTPATLPPRRVVLMGVSGCGKSTVGEGLAERLGWRFVEGDSLHPPENVAKMAAGQALGDGDRAGWLATLADVLAQASAAGQGLVISCSALKRAYRDRIRAQARGVVFVFLHGDARTIHQRMAGRVGHYMRPGLLESQLRTLEVPGPDETDVLHLGIDQPVADLVAHTLEALVLDAPASSSTA